MNSTQSKEHKTSESTSSPKPDLLKFNKETIVPSTLLPSPFFMNLPPANSTPIDDLISFFKYWKYFIKSLIYYFKEISLVKEVEANLHYQLINSVQFPGFKDLPNKVLLEINGKDGLSSPPGTTPTKEMKKIPSSGSLNTMNTNVSNVSNGSKGASVNFANSSSANSIASTNTSNGAGGATSSGPSRPGLLKTKSNNSFLKSIPSNQSLHKRNMSFPSKPTPPVAAHHHNDIKVPKNFFPEDSLFNNLPPLLLNYHQKAYQTHHKLHKDLNNKLIPRLETLLKNLTSKIKEIKSSLKNESFSNTELAKEVSETGQVLYQYMDAVERYSNKIPVLKKKLLLKEDRQEEEDDGVKDDPFLIKLLVDYQIKNQLIHENYMFASYVNLQNISKDLFTYVLKELNFAVDKFGKLAFNLEFYTYLKSKISVSSSKDWEHFISSNPNFVNIYNSTELNPKREIRNFKSLQIPYSTSIHNKCIRFGMLYKKSKILKNYNRYYYVLSCNYLHEFRIENDENGVIGIAPGANSNNSVSTPPHRKDKLKDKIGGFIGHESVPTKSYNLNDCLVKVKDEKSFKFQIIKNSNQLKKTTFKCLNIAEYNNWFGDLEQLLRFGSNHLERLNFVTEQTELKETEVAGSKQTKPVDTATKPATEPKNMDQLKLNLKNGNAGLSGIFTPTIRTPSYQAGEESNPFDQTFLSDISGNVPIATGAAESPNTAQGNSNSNTTPGEYTTGPGPYAETGAYISYIGPPGASPVHSRTGSMLSNGSHHSRNTSPSITPTMSPSSVFTGIPSFQLSPHQQEHETYLKMQQEILKQQQEILSLKINEIESAERLSVSRQASNESITSFTPTAHPQLQNMLNTHHNMVPKPAVFELDRSVVEEKAASTPDLPQMFVSNH